MSIFNVLLVTYWKKRSLKQVVLDLILNEKKVWNSIFLVFICHHILAIWFIIMRLQLNAKCMFNMRKSEFHNLLSSFYCSFLSHFGFGFFYLVFLTGHGNRRYWNYCPRSRRIKCCKSKLTLPYPWTCQGKLLVSDFFHFGIALKQKYQKKRRKESILHFTDQLLR